MNVPIWFRVICAVTAAALTGSVVQGWWQGSITLIRLTAKHQVYVGTKGAAMTLAGPLELVAATLLLGGIASIFGLLAVKPVLLRKPWVVGLPLIALVSGAALLHGWDKP